MTSPADKTAQSTYMADIPYGPQTKITVERQGQIILIGINRPYIDNRLDPEATESLAKAYYDYDRDPSLRAAVLFGYGERFSRGVDVDAYKSFVQSGKKMMDGPGFIDPLGRTKPTLTKPLVVAVHGDTWNMAHELFLVADIRVASEDTEFGQDENTHGRFPGGGATVRFPSEAGWGNAMRYILTGDHWGAKEAFQMGTVQELAPNREAALAKAIEIANKIAACGPLGVKASLASSHVALDESQTAALAKLGEQYRALLTTRDFQEGRDAEAQNRPPVYEGR
ncbi:enoyl-CoA hydratase-related protein [Bradyrhizobium sp. GCM10027634]|uniref:enoyl-CoA hydratase-related protein n=1 Tax=unclassified Bradyrhizobium TaxID=2631580 RepID=UPI00263A5089|nr:enoyl-CoA hydratase-related protein [Bradyrhizobium sp. WYCCWR 12677]MDN5005497.1 enoyl-CoA hydratase-related protein [Bradyrhizobium sp. WYCCWR 12677]